MRGCELGFHIYWIIFLSLMFLIIFLESHYEGLNGNAENKEIKRKGKKDKEIIMVLL